MDVKLLDLELCEKLLSRVGFSGNVRRVPLHPSDGLEQLQHRIADASQEMSASPSSADMLGLHC
eukprot:2422400-Amphidinium_carterae.1